MDEPVSNLDADSEAGLTAAMAKARRGRTVLVIAHRLSTIRSADRLVVLERGRVVETGRHDELAGRRRHLRPADRGPARCRHVSLVKALRSRRTSSEDFLPKDAARMCGEGRCGTADQEPSRTSSETGANPQRGGCRQLQWRPHLDPASSCGR